MSWLSNVNWDQLSKTINTVGTAAGQISNTVNALKPSKVAANTTTSSDWKTTSSGSSDSLVTIGVLVLAAKLLKLF